MIDPTQEPPFYPSCRITDGVVTEMTGNANAYWAFANDAILITEGQPVAIGWLYADGRFIPPPGGPTVLPAQEA